MTAPHFSRLLRHAWGYGGHILDLSPRVPTGEQPQGVELNWLFNVTINDISVIYVTAHRCAGGLKKLDLRSGSQRHGHFVGFFNVPVLAPTRDHHGDSDTPPHLVAFYNHAGDTEDTFST